MQSRSPPRMERPTSEQTNNSPRNVRYDIRNRRGMITSGRLGRVEEVGSVIVKIELMGKTEGHPMFQVSMTSKKDNHMSTTVLLKRFKHFRALHNRIAELSNLKRVYCHRFPESHWQSHFGLLGDDCLHERAQYLEKWMNEVLCLSESEGWGMDIQNELSDFLEPQEKLSASVLNSHETLSKSIDVRQSRAQSIYENEVSTYHDSSTLQGIEDSFHASRNSNQSLLNETWPPLLTKRPSSTPSMPPGGGGGGGDYETASRAGSIASRRLSSIFSNLGCQFGHWEGYDDESDFVLIFEGEIKDVKLGALALTNKWRSGYWKLVWSDVSKSEAALLRYREKDLPNKIGAQEGGGGSCDENRHNESMPYNSDSSSSLHGSSHGNIRVNGSNVSRARDVLPLRIIRAVDKLTDDRLKKVINKNPEFGFSFVLSLVDGNEVILAAPSEQDRQEWMGILYSTLIKQVSNGQHDDAKLIGSVCRASSAWENTKLPDEEEDNFNHQNEDNLNKITSLQGVVTAPLKLEDSTEDCVVVVEEYFTTPSIKEESLSESKPSEDTASSLS